MKKYTFVILCILLILSQAALAQKQQRIDEPPYGHFEQHGKRRYGNPFAVKTKEDAIEIVKSYYGNSSIIIGNIFERRRFFLIEILDDSKKVIDIIAVDKRSGRIRSIF